MFRSLLGSGLFAEAAHALLAALGKLGSALALPLVLLLPLLQRLDPDHRTPGKLEAVAVPLGLEGARLNNGILL